MGRARWLLLVLLASCICPRRDLIVPALNGRIVDEHGAPQPEAQVEVCQSDGNLCSKLLVSSGANFHAEERAETNWGCLCIPQNHSAADYIVRATAEGMLPSEVAVSSAQQVVLHPRSVDADLARRSLVVLYRSVNGFSVVLTAAWLQEATREGFSLRVPTPGVTLDQALGEVERSLAVEAAQTMSCRDAVRLLVNDSADPFVVRYGTNWQLLRTNGEHAPLRRLISTLQPNSTSLHDDAPAATALAHGQPDRVAEEVCGSAVGAPGGVAVR